MCLYIFAHFLNEFALKSSLRVDSFLEGFHFPGKQTGNHKICLFLKNMAKKK